MGMSHGFFSAGDSHLTQLYVLRGIPEQRLKSGDAQRDLMGYCCKSVREMLEMYLQCGTFYTRNIVESVVDRLPVCTPFPQFFDPLVGTDGDITDVARSQDAGSNARRWSLVANFIVHSCQVRACACRLTLGPGSRAYA